MNFPADNAWIGMATDERTDWHDEYTGSLDDFTIYDCPLSAAEVGYPASNGIGIFSVQSPTNLVSDEPLGDRAVNLRDLAVLGVEWLKEDLWP